MPQSFESFGLQFLYPDNWTQVERSDDEGKEGVTLELPSGGFFTVERTRAGELVEEVIEGLDGVDGETGTRYPLAALVMPATLDHIRAISEYGERMPAKSTYFYPKLLSGLVINVHE